MLINDLLRYSYLEQTAIERAIMREFANARPVFNRFHPFSRLRPSISWLLQQRHAAISRRIQELLRAKG